MLAGLPSGLKWINWLNTHGGWSETASSLPHSITCDLCRQPFGTLRPPGYISPPWKLVPPSSSPSGERCTVLATPSNKKVSLGNLSTRSLRARHIDVDERLKELPAVIMHFVTSRATSILIVGNIIKYFTALIQLYISQLLYNFKERNE